MTWWESELNYIADSNMSNLTSQASYDSMTVSRNSKASFPYMAFIPVATNESKGGIKLFVIDFNHVSWQAAGLCVERLWLMLVNWHLQQLKACITYMTAIINRNISGRSLLNSNQRDERIGDRVKSGILSIVLNKDAICTVHFQLRRDWLN